MVAQLLTFAMTWALVAQGAATAPEPSPSGAAAATAIPAASPRPREDLAGQWKYNPDQSINAATGRLEMARAANERRGAATAGAPRGGPGFGPGLAGGAGPGPGGGFPGAGPGDPGGGGGGGGFGSGIPPSAALSIYQQSRDTLRDLMEIPPGLAFEVTSTSVVLTDDLERTLTFPTDGRKQKYLLGAASFDARARWDGSKFRLDIEGPNSLKMNETMFLSEDGSRLFVIIRVGEPAKGERPTGVNRVYDRVR